MSHSHPYPSIVVLIMNVIYLSLDVQVGLFFVRRNKYPYGGLACTLSIYRQDRYRRQHIYNRASTNLHNNRSCRNHRQVVTITPRCKSIKSQIPITGCPSLANPLCYPTHPEQASSLSRGYMHGILARRCCL